MLLVAGGAGGNANEEEHGKKTPCRAIRSAITPSRKFKRMIDDTVEHWDMGAPPESPKSQGATHSAAAALPACCCALAAATAIAFHFPSSLSAARHCVPQLLRL